MVNKIPGGVELTHTEASVLSNNHTIEFGHLGIRAALKVSLESGPSKVMMSDKTVGRIVEQFHGPLHDSENTIEFTEKEFLISLIDSCREFLLENKDVQG